MYAKVNNEIEIVDNSGKLKKQQPEKESCHTIFKFHHNQQRFRGA